MGILSRLFGKKKKEKEKEPESHYVHTRPQNSKPLNGRRVMMEGLASLPLGRGMRFWIEKEGYEVLVPPYDGREGAHLEFYEQYKPDMVLMDAGYGGEKKLAELKGAFPSAQVVMCLVRDGWTPTEIEELVMKCIRAGAKDFLLLPVERERLLRSVKALCGP